MPSPLLPWAAIVPAVWGPVLPCGMSSVGSLSGTMESMFAPAKSMPNVSSTYPFPSSSVPLPGIRRCSRFDSSSRGGSADPVVEIGHDHRRSPTVSCPTPSARRCPRQGVEPTPPTLSPDYPAPQLVEEADRWAYSTATRVSPSRSASATSSFSVSTAASGFSRRADRAEVRRLRASRASARCARLDPRPCTIAESGGASSDQPVPQHTRRDDGSSYGGCSEHRQKARMHRSMACLYLPTDRRSSEEPRAAPAPRTATSTAGATLLAIQPGDRPITPPDRERESRHAQASRQGKRDPRGRLRPGDRAPRSKAPWDGSRS